MRFIDAIFLVLIIFAIGLGVYNSNISGKILDVKPVVTEKVIVVTATPEPTASPSATLKKEIKQPVRVITVAPSK